MPSNVDYAISCQNCHQPMTPRYMADTICTACRQAACAPVPGQLALFPAPELKGGVV